MNKYKFLSMNIKYALSFYVMFHILFSFSKFQPNASHRINRHTSKKEDFFNFLFYRHVYVESSSLRVCNVLHIESRRVNRKNPAHTYNSEKKTNEMSAEILSGRGAFHVVRKKGKKNVLTAVSGIVIIIRI